MTREIDRLTPNELSEEQRAAFLAYVKDHPDCSVREACEEVGVRRKDVRALKRSSAEFEEDYRTARGYGQEQIMNSVVKLAIKGVEEPLVSAGKLVRDENGDVVTVRKYSDRLLQVLVHGFTPEGKAMMANKLGIEISGPDGGPIEVQRGISFEEVAKVLAAAGKNLELEAPEGTAEVVSEEDS